MDHRTLEEFDEFFRELKNRIEEQVHEVFRQEKHKPPGERKLVTFVSDKLWQYRMVFNRYFRRIARLVYGVPIACKQYGLEHNNNPSSATTKTSNSATRPCGTSRALPRPRLFLDLRRAIYNFVRTHQTLKRTPAEAAGIDLELGRNRLLDLIKVCSVPP